ncbi:carboxymuconolactone decarboxylase family protein [Enorma phocaeensis]|uniref:Carboxymuconolactone decarboxylase family protein n=1 Tax=Enorma phocaeensis TaxID=1871019 RepID=A0ABT7V8X7_9ACTN|nr:carboxymuconolactone decarboxylase family protein [Enorma phocaeensis]MDM8274953.1 carboxymuconolactone decarboxylase family protein [Enorma phocaeensis]
MVKQTAGRNTLGVVAPKFAELNDDVLFGEVWSREDKLSLKMRSIVTVVTLVAKGLTDTSFEHHMANAKANGVTRDEMAEILTHEAFYAGWPNSWAAFRVMLKIYGDEADDGKGAEFKPMFGMGNPNEAFARYFVGNSYLNPLTNAAECGVGLSNVTFEPGCRNNWHVHRAERGGGQVLIVTDGRGWYQEWGKDPQALAPGSVVVIPAGVKHWHGAAADSWFSHIAFEAPGEGCSNEWLEPVDDEQYPKA